MSKKNKEMFQKTNDEIINDMLDYFKTYYTQGEVGKIESLNFFNNFKEYVFRLNLIKSENYEVKFNLISKNFLIENNYYAFMTKDDEKTFNIYLEYSHYKQSSQKTFKSILENKKNIRSNEYIIFNTSKDSNILASEIQNFIQRLFDVGHELKHVVQYINENNAMIKDDLDLNNCDAVLDFVNRPGTSFNIKNHDIKMSTKKESIALQYASYSELSADKFGYYYVQCLLTDLIYETNVKIKELKNQSSLDNDKQISSLVQFLNFLIVCSDISSQSIKQRKKLTAKYKLQLNELEAKHQETIKPIESELI